MNNDHAIGFGIGLLAGVAVGGVVALLFAPKTGEETRQLIKDTATETIDTARDKTGRIIEAVKESASEANRKGQAAIQALKS